jgi:anaerobic selenocysteine-containing dehydrogenase
MSTQHGETEAGPAEAQDAGLAGLPFQKTACILCSINCGIQAVPKDGHLHKIRGDREHPLSQGYTCEKAHRLDYYQNGRDRLTSPLRRRPDGSFEPIDWDTAIREVAARLAAVRDTHGGDTIFYYGGGSQGNHLPGAYARATRAALGSIYASNALAQEKTGEFWVDGRLYGAPKCHTTPDFEHAEVAIFIGKNPWQSHGSPRTRVVLKAIAADPTRTLVVIDPRRTETAELADIHIQVRPGRDAFVLSALCAILLAEGWLARDFIAQRTDGFDTLQAAFASIDVAAYAAHAGVPLEQLRYVAQRMATARGGVAIQEDLGVQQAPHSTLSSYLEKLLYLLVGSFARRGGMNLHSHFAPLIGKERDARTPVTGHRLLQGMVPCNIIPDEILGDHPKRMRAMLVESANPAHSVADSQRMRQALTSLDTLVVIDVAMSETARLAHYVLPAPSQFEKWETAFFNLEFPRNAIQLRAPLFPAAPGTLPEPEIHRRLVRALGAFSDADVADLQAAAAEIPKSGRLPFAAAFFAWQATHPKQTQLAPVVLYETLGAQLPGGAGAAAVLWAAAHLCAMSYPNSVRRAGFVGEGPMLGEALFDGILHSRSGVVFTVDEPDETWRRIEHKDGRIHLVIPELLAELAELPRELSGGGTTSSEFPFVLSAGERRTSTANTNLRDPAWRKKDLHGALRMAPADAARLGIPDGGAVRITTRRGSATTVIEITASLQPGHVTLPNGLGLLYPDESGQTVLHGIPPNELTASADRDWLAGTPHHKHVPAQISAISAQD